jgi:hypothetical protein
MGRLVAVLLVTTCFGQVPVIMGRKYLMHSHILKEARAQQVIVPASCCWALDRRYPLLDVLDGKTVVLNAAWSPSLLAALGEMPEVVVVAISSTVRIRDFT